jgi:hypothetical protein
MFSLPKMVHLGRDQGHAEETEIWEPMGGGRRPAIPSNPIRDWWQLLLLNYKLG